MRIKNQKATIHEGDLTPMIDMTFQLIAFFMVLVNFTDTDPDQRIQLPSSVLAKPPDTVLNIPLTIQLTKDGKVVIGGEECTIDDVKSKLTSEKQFLEYQEKSAADATVIVRADKVAKTGLVQKLVEVCQEAGFEKFALRAEQEQL
jgi:biopolymer transport protein ExbD